MIMCRNAAASGAPYTNDIVFTVAANGDVFATSYNVWSSREYKKNIEEIQFSSQQIKNISPCLYKYKSEKDNAANRIGLMWEDVIKICPLICLESEKGKTIDHMGLCAYLFSIIKELELRITNLEKHINI